MSTTAKARLQIKKALDLLAGYHYNHIYGIDIGAFVYHKVKNNRVKRLASLPRTFEPRTVSDSSYRILTESLLLKEEGFRLKKVTFKKEGSIFPHSLFLAIVDPRHFKFKVISRERPLSTRQWFNCYNPFFLTNGGFFKTGFIPDGLVKCENGIRGDFNRVMSGVLCVEDHDLDIHWSKNLETHNIQKMSYVLQAGPLIIEPDFTDGIYSDNKKEDRRTVVGKDGDGKVVFAVCPTKSLSLYGIMQFLKYFEIKVCLNLDGGTSTSFCLSSSQTEYYLPSIKKVPNIIAVFRK